MYKLVHCQQKKSNGNRIACTDMSNAYITQDKGVTPYSNMSNCWGNIFERI